MTQRIGVLFVCLGNICRSPLAEGVFKAVVTQSGLEDRFDIDSAGTSAFHVGDTPDPRTLDVATRRGVRLDHTARQVAPADLDRFHYIIAMDLSNLGRLERLAERVRGRAELHLLRAFDAAADGDLEVPDPYFGGADGFEDVHDMVERASEGLLEHIRSQHRL
jgi:protein-tyrosine phosphatase